MCEHGLVEVIASEPLEALVRNGITVNVRHNARFDRAAAGVDHKNRSDAFAESTCRRHDRGAGDLDAFEAPVTSESGEQVEAMLAPCCRTREHEVRRGRFDACSHDAVVDQGAEQFVGRARTAPQDDRSRIAESSNDLTRNRIGAVGRERMGTFADNHGVAIDADDGGTRPNELGRTVSGCSRGDGRAAQIDDERGRWHIDTVDVRRQGRRREDSRFGSEFR